MNKKDFLVIGSNSFSGSNFVAGAIKKGFSVVGVSRSAEPNQVFLPYYWSGELKKKNLEEKNSFNFYSIDLNKQLNELIEIISNYRPEYIVNFAAQGMVAESWLKSQGVKV